MIVFTVDTVLGGFKSAPKAPPKRPLFDPKAPPNRPLFDPRGWKIRKDRKDRKEAKRQRGKEEGAPQRTQSHRGRAIGGEGIAAIHLSKNTYRGEVRPGW